MLEVRCQEHLDKTRAYADEHGIRSDLEHWLSYLENFAGGKHVCVLTKDFAPHSFDFVMFRIAEDGTRSFWFNGGLIHHGAGSTGVGLPELAVTLMPKSQPHWSVHT